jgi:hypothetical protein
LYATAKRAELNLRLLCCLYAVCPYRSPSTATFQNTSWDMRELYSINFIISVINKFGAYLLLLFNRQLHNILCWQFDLPFTLLRVWMRRHHHKGISVYTELTKTVTVQSTVIYRRQNKVKRLKHHIGLFRKPVTIYLFYLN